ncbi:DUF563 domain-containing protein [Cyanobium sp. CH-040]|uniref:glycosyltransferase family 61 protein n=1 Tax=Cyanobium sp. CH-040 TaxID=2823708 RepID=UPI0020CD801E|nr:glycosyltransferase 61 family protein [Cyanobium sp. CH-040]MCP9926744.1 glycosyltransferase family 61 protein [Cyanobium sp. CH-040]
MALSKTLQDLILYTPGPRQTGYAKTIALEAGGEYQVVYPASSTTFTPPNQDNSLLGEFLLQCAKSDHPEVFIASFPKGRFHAGGVILSPDGATVARDLSEDFGRPFSEHFLLNKRIKRPRRVPGPVLFTGVKGASSYYHWLMDELPRVLITPSDFFQTLACSRISGVQAEALQLLPMKGKRLISVDNENGKSSFVADNLISPSYLAETGHPSDRLVQTLKAFVEPLIDRTTRYPEKLYISRRGSGKREIVGNGGLGEELGRRGFTELFLESMSWREQVNAFSHAREIVAAHGAGLANLVFCRNTPLVVELFNSKYVHWCFWKLSSLVGANYLPIATPYGPVSHQAGRSNIEVAPIDVRGLVHYIDKNG